MRTRSSSPMGQTFAEATTPYGCRWPEIPRNLQGMSLSALSQEFDIPQERRVVTAIPGPKSDALMQRRADAVARGVGTTLPVSRFVSYQPG